MLLRKQGEEHVAIGQASHAWLSGQLARAWRPRPQPWEAVCLAAEQHDVGMAQWDLTPTLNRETGLPHTFLEMPLDTHLRLWHEAPARLLTQSRYAALLVSMHGTALYEMRDLSRMAEADADAVRDYLATQRALQERLAAEVGADAAALRAQQRLVFTWDGLSLALCLDWAPFSVHGMTLRDGAVLEPWPFDGDEVVVGCEGRRLEGRYESERELHAALERAERVELRFVLRREGA